MNKTHRTIWNESLGAWVAASEVAGARGKKPRSTAIAGAAASVAMLLGFGMPGAALAQSAVCEVNGTSTTLGSATGNFALACGNGTSAAGAESIAFGDRALTTQAWGIAIGQQAASTNLHAIAIGTQSVASGVNAVAMANQAEASGQSSIALGAVAKATTTDAVAIGSGAQASAATGAGASTAIGAGAKATSNGFGSTAVGARAQASGSSSIAIGSEEPNQTIATTASGPGAIALGARAQASATNSTAMGVDANASGNAALAVGYQSQAKNTNSIAIGETAVAQQDGSVAIGAESTAGDGGAVAGWQATALGHTAVATAQHATALGANNVVTAAGTDSTAVGSGNTVSGARSTAVGVGNVVSGTGSGAFGDPNIISGSGSYALGNNNTIAQNNTFVVGNTVTTTQANSVVLGNASTDRAATTETGVMINGTPYTFAGPGSAANGVVSVGAVGAERQVINVAAGQISAASTDAINGSQLFATNQAVSKLSNGGAGPVQYSNPATATTPNGGTPTNDVTLVGAAAGPVVVHNVGAGAVAPGSTDAVNGDQFYKLAGDTSTAYTTANGVGVKYVRTNDTGLAADDAHATVAGATAVGYNATASQAWSVALGRNSLADGSTLATAAFVPSGASSVAGSAPVGEVSIGRAGQERRLTNVAAGATDTDAVNVSQLKAVDSKISTLSQTALAYDDASKGKVTLGGPVSTDGGVTGGTTLSNVHQGAVSSTSTDAVNGSQLFATQQLISNVANGGTKYFHANSTLADSQAVGTDSVAIGPQAKASNAGDVALGANSVTGAAKQVSSATINGTTYGGFAGAAPTSVVSVGDVGKERQITNVGAGEISATSTDAVNGSQVYSVAVGLEKKIVAANASGTQYDKNPDGSVNYESVTLQGGTKGTQVHNVAAGTSGTDAVNVNQLNDAMKSAVGQAKDYTDSRFNELSGQIGEVQKRSDAAAAGAMAMGSIPQSIYAGKSLAGAGVASIGGQTALALGLSGVSDGGRWIYKASAMVNTQKKVGVGVGAGFQF